MRRLLLIPVLAAAAIPATAALAGAGDQRVAVGAGVSVVLPAGWHLTHGKGTPLIEPIPRLSAATFPVHFSKQHCVCDTPRVADFPRDGAYLFVMEYPALGRRDARRWPAHSVHFHIARSAIAPGDCGPSDGRMFREGGRGYQVQIYLGAAAPASARRQIAFILDSWQVTP
ncbi:MAG TPA: hypothetical protein VGH67_13250 [Solirubrobacteraceae bacterium]|jgi:hypothetical protein